jgi:hypothetical protein
MALVCAQCSSVNPPDAAYCYHDGAALAGRAGGPINPGSAHFASPFVFPNGQACRNFDQLAMTCQQNWAAALDLLKQGFLSSFFGGLGRVDLAVAAQEAAKFPDPDRGLDQLLAKIPTQVLEPPKLQAEPSEISLGQLAIGSDRTIELHLRNGGMRLLYGSVASDAKWLTLGDLPGQPEKVFQFGEETVIAVQVRGQHLRAGTKPLQGQLVLDSNGGSVTVTVRADVPVTPFPGGPFDGAVTPRQVAEKAKAHPKETAPLFEDGRVAAWFQSNGWTYPVQGPPMSGMGAVQQFFEALGVAKPPQVHVGPTTLRFEGAPGKVYDVDLEVSSTERKVVYGWATSDRLWAEVGKTKLTGRSTIIPIKITVPDRKGTQEASLTVIGNGQQKFVVPVTVAVIGGADILDAEVIDTPEYLDEPPIDVHVPVMMPAAAPPRPPSFPSLNVDAPARPLAPSTASMELPAVRAPAHVTPMPVPVMRSPMPVAPPPAHGAHAPAAVQPIAAGPAPLVGAGMVSFEEFSQPGVLAAAPDLVLGAPGAVLSRPAGLIAPPPRRSNRWMHAIPLALLLMVVSGTCVRDAVFALFERPTIVVSDIDPRPLLGLHFNYNFDPKKVDAALGSSMMAGLVVYDLEHGKIADPKRLTFGRNGHTNSVVVKLDGKDRVFGDIQKGRYVMKPKDVGIKGQGGKICAYEFLPERVVVTQEVRLIPGEPIEVSPGEFKRLLDLCLFKYTIKNEDTRAHDVGLRYLLDTFIGSNDEVPFTLPSQPGLVDTTKEMIGNDVPDFIQVLESSELRNTGVIAQLNLRLGKFEPPNRVKLTAHPMVQQKQGISKDTWEIPLASIKQFKDSCVVMYWDPAPMGPQQTREMGFTYGLGNLSIGKSAKLGLTVGGAMLVNSDLTVVALVADPQPGQTAQLVLPPGLTLTQGTAEQQVPPSLEKTKDGRPLPSPVTWRVRPSAEGTFHIDVETRIGGEVVTQQRNIVVTRAKAF